MATSTSGSVITDSVVAFLKTVPPFQFLPPFELAALAGFMTLEYFPRETVILTAGSRAADSLYIIQKGGVKLAIRTAVGKELTLDIRSEGECFGLLSLMSRDVARLDVASLADTLCYAVPAAQVQNLAARHPEVADYLFRTSVTRYMDRALAELRERTRLMPDGERLLYSLAVGEVATTAALVCPEDTSVGEAAKLASDANTTFILVAGAEGKAVGIVTEKDFTSKVVATGLPLASPVKTIMSAPVVAVESSQRVFQALLAMLGRNIHHVVVTEGGQPKSVLTVHDLMLLQGKSPLSVAREIESMRTVDELAGAQKRIRDLLPLLMREGARASHIGRVVAEVSDRVLIKILQLAEAELGAPPAPYCWVALGSEGRSEQTFTTDQDNGLIYADGLNAGAAEYFERLAILARDALIRCGHLACPGEYMASNPKWRQALGGWQRYFRTCIESADLRSTEDALILFDMRPVAGDRSLFDNLREEIARQLAGAGLFKSILAFLSVDSRPPLGFFGKFVVERSGLHKAELDIKLSGTQPIVSAARLLALDAGVRETNTVDRLRAVESLGGEHAALVGDLHDSFEFLMLLRLELQLQQAHAGRPLSNYVRHETLSTLHRSTLKQAFHTIGRAQSWIESRFRSAEWAQLRR